MNTAEADPVVRRLELSALSWCLLISFGSWIWRGGETDLALGVLAGGALIGASYWAIKKGIDSLVVILASGFTREDESLEPISHRVTPQVKRPMPVPQITWALLKLVARYALLGLMAYVMISRLRLHAVGMFLGASSMVAAATIEAIRSVIIPWNSSRR